MAGRIDWYYYRSGCTACEKAGRLLEDRGVEVKERRSASAKLGRDEALRLAKAASKIIASRGHSVVVFDMRRNPPGERELLAAMLGPTGNLRAPLIRKGKTLLVGFNEDAYVRTVSK